MYDITQEYITEYQHYLIRIINFLFNTNIVQSILPMPWPLHSACHVLSPDNDTNAMIHGYILYYNVDRKVITSRISRSLSHVLTLVLPVTDIRT
jgi:hypothetical protein